MLDLHSIDEQFVQIDRSFRNSIRQSLWLLDTAQLNSQIDGVLHLRDISRVEITKDDKILYEKGDPPEKNAPISRSNLTYRYNNTNIKLGELVLYASLQGVYSRLIDKVWVILISNGVKTFFVSIFVYLLFQYLVTRHIQKIIRFIRRYEISAETHGEKLSLDRTKINHSKTDELDELVSTFNYMDEKLRALVIEAETKGELFKKNEARFETSQKFANLGIWEWDIKTGELYWSNMVAPIFGYEKRPDNPSFDMFISIVHPDDQQNVRDAIDKSLAGIENYEIEHRVIRPDGEIRWVHEKGNVEKDADGNPTKMLGVVRDITQKRDTAEQLYQAQKMEAVGQLTGGIAHDFNNLLAVMLGNTELLEDYISDDENARYHYDKIKQTIENSAALTQRLLVFSRKQALASETIDIRGLVGGLDDMLRRALGETIDLRAIHAVDLWSAFIDPHQLENALVNLAVNAHSAMPKGGTLTIETANITLDEAYAKQNEEATPGDYVVVSVTDTGTGISPEILNKVFEPFFTTKDIGEGSGLGLSMIYGFVKQSNGHITVSSKLDYGTTFKLYFPRSQDIAAPKNAKVATPIFEPASGRILIVEDNPHVRNVPTKILRIQGYDVTEAKDGAEAIDHLQNGQPFDLLFTDVVLPGNLNGIEIAEEAVLIQPDIKILYTSGYAESAINHSDKLIPGVTLINKPYNRSDLLEKVSTILEGNTA